MKSKLTNCQFTFEKKGTCIFIRINDLASYKSMFKDNDYQGIVEAIEILKMFDRKFAWFMGKLEGQTVNYLTSNCFTNSIPNQARALAYLEHPSHNSFI
jgi:hypothetical protein